MVLTIDRVEQQIRQVRIRTGAVKHSVRRPQRWCLYEYEMCRIQRAMRNIREYGNRDAADAVSLYPLCLNDCLCSCIFPLFVRLFLQRMSPSSLLLLTLAFIGAVFVVADCGIGGIDLTSLSTEDWSFTDAQSNEWLLRPCAPLADPSCLKAGPQTASCDANTATAYGDWTTQLWHKWSFLVR